jgi:hypothetical protein
LKKRKIPYGHLMIRGREEWQGIEILSKAFSKFTRLRGTQESLMHRPQGNFSPPHTVGETRIKLDTDSLT